MVHCLSLLPANIPLPNIIQVTLHYLLKPIKVYFNFLIRSLIINLTSNDIPPEQSAEQFSLCVLVDYKQNAGTVKLSQIASRQNHFSLFDSKSECYINHKSL